MSDLSSHINAALQLNCAVTFERLRTGDIVCMIDLPPSIGPGPIEHVAPTITAAFTGVMQKLADTCAEVYACA